MCRLLVLLISALALGEEAAITPVPFSDVQVDGGFWGPRLDTNRRVTVHYDLDKCEKTGRIANFARAGGLEEGAFQGIAYNDSDVYKVIEGASYTLATHADAALAERIDAVIAKIAAAQEDDGYLYTARTLGATNAMTGPERWSNLAASHELYNVGHLFEAAVAHHRATGKRPLLDVALKNADLLCATFGPGKLERPPGHQEVEIGLVKLSQATGERKYLDLARFFLDIRGREREGDPLRGEYQQDHAPVLEQREAVGHAVRACYMYAAMADIALLTGDKGYRAAVETLWQDVVSRKMFLTGGVGARGSGEAFGEAFELPNASAYNETCAAIACALWAQRMFLLTSEASYVDVLERILYNGFLAGVSESGDRFFYPNPLASDGRTKFNHGSAERAPWFDCSCCPVSVVRFMPQIPGMAFATREDRLYVNLFVACEAKATVDGKEVRLGQRTDYPAHGRIEIEVRVDEPFEFELRLRRPGWLQGRPLPGDLYSCREGAAVEAVLKVNGEDATFLPERGYLCVRRVWSAGDVVSLDLPMEVRRVVARDEVEADHGLVALERGPVVYCVEGADHGGHVANLFLPDEAVIEVSSDGTLTASARAVHEQEDGSTGEHEAKLTAVPYYRWCERGPNEMRVWIPREAKGARRVGQPTLAGKATPSASHTWRADTLEALNDGVDPARSSDSEIPRFTWWDHLGTPEWVSYEFGKAHEVMGIEVYWFDDTGVGECRTPLSARLLYRAKGEWRPVEPSASIGVEVDRFNSLRFEQVDADALRIEVDLRPGASGGILEWKVR